MKQHELKSLGVITFSVNYQLTDGKTILYNANHPEDYSKEKSSNGNIINLSPDIINFTNMLRPLIGLNFKYALDFHNNTMYIFFDKSIELTIKDLDNNFPVMKYNKIISDKNKNILLVDISETISNYRYISSIYDNNTLVDIDFSKLKEARQYQEKSLNDSEHVTDINVEQLDTNISAVKELNDLVGLSSAKDKLSQLIAIARVQKLREEQGITQSFSSSNHMIFNGNPGTGKTTAAKLFATAMYQNNVIQKNKFVSTNRSDLVAGYIGQTAKKTRDVIKSALGGVLFIDEAYTLVKPDDPQDFGHEAIDELLDDMEKHRNNLIVILAGYTNKMGRFLDANPGLRSRIPNRIMFDDYSPEDLLKIIHINIEKENIIKLEDTKYFDKKVISYIKSNHPNGNARWARNFYQSLLQVQAMRIAFINNIDKDTLMNVTNEDVNNALKETSLN